MIFKKPLLSDYIRRQRYAMVKPYITGSVLDVGCAAGYLLEVQPSIKEYVGIDIDTTFLDKAKIKYPQHTFYRINLEEKNSSLILQNQTFDVIVMLAILEHLSNPIMVLRDLSKLLKPNGVIVATTPTSLGHRIHNIGSTLRIFSREAADDHKYIVSESGIKASLRSTDLNVTAYKRFEIGCNQIIVMSKNSL